MDCYSHIKIIATGLVIKVALPRIYTENGGFYCPAVVWGVGRAVYNYQVLNWLYAKIHSGVKTGLASSNGNQGPKSDLAGFLTIWMSCAGM